MSRWFALWLVLASTAMQFVPNVSAGQTVAQPKVKPMDAAEFEKLFNAKDWTAVEVARSGGATIVPLITPHLHDKDEVKRLLAVNCLAVISAPTVPPLLVAALSDANEQVRNNAINALHVQLPIGMETQLLAVWDATQTRDGYVRQQIPMIIGRLPGATGTRELKLRLAKDARIEVKDGIVAGASKLGDAESRAIFGNMLRDARGKRTAELIEFVKYLNEPWVIPLLVPVLKRRDIAVDLSTHRNTVLRRDCDLAVDEIMRISKARFTFSLNPIAQYREDQIAEVLRYAESAR